MDLKELLGEELFNQVTAKCGDKTKIAIVSDGNWFPKDKFDTVNNENKELKKQLGERDGQLKDLEGKAKGNEDLLKQIQTLQETNKKVTEEYDAKIKQQAFDFTLDKAITGAKAKNPKAIKALLDLTKIKIDGENLQGFSEQIEALQKSDAYLFGETVPGSKGNNPPPSNAEPASLADALTQYYQNK